jgi:hypothetical protein
MYPGEGMELAEFCIEGAPVNVSDASELLPFSLSTVAQEQVT